MSYSLAGFYEEGVKAGYAPIEKGIEVDKARIELQDMVDPQLRDAKKQATLAESSVKQLQARVLQDTVKYNEDSAKALQGIMTNPANKGKPASELYQLAIEGVVDPKQKMAMLKELPKLQQEEANAAKAKEQTEDLQLNHARQLANSINPNDEAGIQKILMQAQVNGLYADQYMKDANDPSNGKTPQERHQKAKDLLLDRLKTISERKQESADAAAAAKANKDHAMIEASNRRIELAELRMESVEKSRTDKETKDESKQRIALQTRYISEKKKIRDDWKKAWATAEKEVDPAKSIELKNQANAEYQSNIATHDAEYRPLYEELNIPLASLSPQQPAAKKPETKQPTPESDFNTKWASLKPGESLVGPDGKTYTKGK